MQFHWSMHQIFLCNIQIMEWIWRYYYTTSHSALSKMRKDWDGSLIWFPNHCRSYWLRSSQSSLCLQFWVEQTRQIFNQLIVQMSLGSRTAAASVSGWLSEQNNEVCTSFIRNWPLHPISPDCCLSAWWQRNSRGRKCFQYINIFMLKKGNTKYEMIITPRIVNAVLPSEKNLKFYFQNRYSNSE